MLTRTPIFTTLLLLGTCLQPAVQLPPIQAGQSTISREFISRQRSRSRSHNKDKNINKSDRNKGFKIGGAAGLLLGVILGAYLANYGIRKTKGDAYDLNFHFLKTFYPLQAQAFFGYRV